MDPVTKGGFQVSRRGSKREQRGARGAKGSKGEQRGAKENMLQSVQMKLSGSKIVISFFLFVLSPCGFFVRYLFVSRFSMQNFTFLAKKLLSWQDF
jgi:hypothetical protein